MGAIGVLRKVEKRDDGPDYMFYCPGCKCYHGVWTTKSNQNNAIWAFNGDMNNPTLSPSLLVHWGEEGRPEMVCHSFIRNGFIEFLQDCTHVLAGTIVRMQTEE